MELNWTEKHSSQLEHEHQCICWKTGVMAGSGLVNIMDNTFLDPFIEGSWMTKHNGKYYFQYGAPGTEFSGYADGVVVGDNPLFDGAIHNRSPIL